MFTQVIYTNVLAFVVLKSYLVRTIVSHHIFVLRAVQLIKA